MLEIKKTVELAIKDVNARIGAQTDVRCEKADLLNQCNEHLHLAIECLEKAYK